MLGKSKRNSGHHAVETLIGARVTIRGDLTFSGGLYVEGTVHGSIKAESDSDAVVTIAEHGLVEGEIFAPVVIISGQLRGNVHAGQRVELTAQARVEGDVHYTVVEMAAGATLSGRLIHAQEERKQLPGPKIAVAS